MNKKISFAALLLMAAVLFATMSCKKVANNINNTDTTNTNPGGSSAQDLLYDSMYYYALQVYYWNTQLPSYTAFNPRKYEQTNDSLGLANEMFAYTRYAKDASGNLLEQLMTYNNNGNLVPDNTHKIPKYSQIYYTSDLDNGNAAYAPVNNNLAMSLNGKDNGYGFFMEYGPVSMTGGLMTANNPDSNVTIIAWVTKGSPADKAGLRRGNVISLVNGQALDFTNNPTSASVAYENALNSNNLTLTLYNPATKSDTTVKLQSGVYNYNPILKSEVINYSGHKIGYLAFQIFSDSLSSVTALDTAFSSYSNQGITDIVVDLRYNGGGYVSTAEYLANLLAPTSANNKVMHTDYYNQTMINHQATILKNVPLNYNNPSSGNMFDNINYSTSVQTTSFKKAGGINLPNVYFIVSDETASASELLINSLAPFVNETLIGAAYSTATYGKPVAFFEIRIGKYSLFTPNFEMKNANGYGEYYQGLPVSYQNQVFDNITYDLGDIKEDALAKAIYLITGKITNQSASAQSNNRVMLRAVGRSITFNNIKFMIGTPKRNFK